MCACMMRACVSATPYKLVQRRVSHLNPSPVANQRLGKVSGTRSESRIRSHNPHAFQPRRREVLTVGTKDQRDAMPGTFQRNACASVALGDTCGIPSRAFVLSTSRSAFEWRPVFIYRAWFILTQKSFPHAAVKELNLHESPITARR